MKNKFICIVMILILTINVSGCHFTQYSELRHQEFKNADIFFDHLKEEDIDSLINMFSDDIRDSCDLEDEWKEFFDVIDGSIESYGSIMVTYSEQFIDDGKITRCLLNVVFYNVTTDEGSEYDTLEYNNYVVHSDQDQLGLCVVRLEDDDEFLCTIGRSNY
ncbi:MAG: DUF5104 domain-containing protein [Saccharofermentans sp.]|nr:DUF5104 domain-containing protein [Saccharofermentans sp.]